MTRLFTSGALACAIAAVSPASTRGAAPEARPRAAARASYVPPRTPWGDPDLQGNYTNKYEQSTPLERPDEFVGRRIDDVTGAELAGVLEKRQRQVLDRPAGVGPYQFRDALEVTKASRAWFLVDPPDGKIPPMTSEALRRIGPPDPAAELGIRGFVTLVVETTNFKNRSTYRNANPATLDLVERFTPTAPGRIEWAVTVDDRTTWTRRWTFSMPLTMDDREPVLEFACHEGNYALPNILSVARSSERVVAEK
jgi:hypothetical protein